MALPNDLVLVRHGESEANVAYQERAAGQPLGEHYFCRPDALVPLTQRGRVQAERTGRWLQGEFPGGFQVGLTSTYTRTQETAALLGLETRWRIEPLVRELPPLAAMLHDPDRAEEHDRVRRELDNDRLHFSHVGRESAASVTDRLRLLLHELSDGDEEGRVVVVTHAGVLSAARIALEGVDPQRWEELELSKEAGDEIRNCQVFHYSRTDPGNGSVSGEYRWVRRVRPADGERGGTWERTAQRTFSSEELLAHSRSERPHLQCVRTTRPTPHQREERGALQ